MEIARSLSYKYHEYISELRKARASSLESIQRPPLISYVVWQVAKILCPFRQHQSPLTTRTWTSAIAGHLPREDYENLKTTTQRRSTRSTAVVVRYGEVHPLQGPGKKSQRHPSFLPLPFFNFFPLLVFRMAAVLSLISTSVFIFTSSLIRSMWLLASKSTPSPLRALVCAREFPKSASLRDIGTANAVL